jgi:hypothetical protein
VKPKINGKMADIISPLKNDLMFSSIMEENEEETKGILSGKKWCTPRTSSKRFAGNLLPW